MGDAKVYPIRTLDDLARIPADRLSACLRDLEYAIQIHNFTFGALAVTVPFEGGEWTDDGKHDQTLLVNGEPFLTLTTREDPPA